MAAFYKACQSSNFGGILWQQITICQSNAIAIFLAVNMTCQSNTVVAFMVAKCINDSWEVLG